MQISSLYLVLFTIIAVFVYFNIKQIYRIYLLTLLSCAFVASFSYSLLLYVVGYATINYFAALKLPHSTYKKLLFYGAIIFNILQLVLLKYVSFTLNPLLGALGFNIDLSIISKIIVPVGVSFFTLQGIGYLINVNTGWEKPEKNFLHFLLYIVFYPKFLSGPVERSNHFLPQLYSEKVFNAEQVSEGLRLVLFGLFKKIAIANQLAPVINGAYSGLNAGSETSFFLVLLLQPIYIYFDFSGYTDIAIGLARAFGINLRPNFNSPFLSENVTSFWKRFHSSLSSWFHDYIFMRTMFKYRKWGKNASYLALLITWLLFGIWHGAGWTFMLLGLLQALAIFYETNTKKLRTIVFSSLPTVLRIWTGRIFTYLFYSFSLVFFFSPDMESVFMFFTRLTGNMGVFPVDIRKEIFIIVIMFAFIFLFIEIFRSDFSKAFGRMESLWYGKKPINILLRWSICFLMITVVIIFNKDVQQFIYFKF